MSYTKGQFTDRTPIFYELITTSEPYTLHIDQVPTIVHVSCDAWDGIRITQTVSLYIDDNVAYTQKVEALDPDSPDGNIGKPPVFNVEARKYFKAGKDSSIYLDYAEGEPPNPNRFLSKTLSFQVKSNSLADLLTIDIAEGAAGYTDVHPYLMPANVAVLRGPANMELEARSVGAVRFQDLDGSETCIFSFNEKGVCPLVLIRIDSIHETDQIAASEDAIILTQRGSSAEIIRKPVIFGEYVPVTGDAAEAFSSVSSNTVGIADGETICVISIIMKDPHNKDILLVKLDTGLVIAPKTFNKGASYIKDIDLPSISIVDGVAEFGVSAMQPGKYNIGVFPQTQSESYFSKAIEFKALS
jgi:hypothetical protein